MIAVIGAGVVGLAIARALAMRGREVVVIERHRRPGLDTSTHNSGVIHAGLYHPPATLKAQLCIEGRERLVAFAAEHAVPHVRHGKLVVAHAGEEAALDRLAATAAANGVVLEPASAAFIRQREPHIRAERALFSPLTGWIDAEAYVRALEDELRRLDVPLVVGTALTGCEVSGDRLTLVTGRERIDVDAIVNAAGLFADDVSKMCGGETFTIYPCRGEYAELAPRARGLVNGLVYPVPHASGHGLGVHLTKTLGGEVWIGPTIDYRERKDDYENGRLPVEAFLEPTRALLPSITVDDLRLGQSGIRAKLHPPTESFADFMIRADRLQPRLFHAAGIDSPGLTASLAIGNYVADRLAT
ncbi:MAG: FAD-dependent oxidoreductase [Acidobacteria bacterium]|nr:MAG: FAD-dependent oxidoreductase [Acidobacteriota bacterium]